MPWASVCSMSGVESPEETEALCFRCQRITMCKPYKKDYVCIDTEDCKQCLSECEIFRQALRAYVQRRGL